MEIPKTNGFEIKKYMKNIKLKESKKNRKIAKI